MEPYPIVTEAHVVKLYVIEVTFSDGTRRRIDIQPLLWAKVFQPLRDPEYFARMTTTGETVRWPNGADIAPETLYRVGTLLVDGKPAGPEKPIWPLDREEPDKQTETAE